jgi:ATP-dependent Clp protease ATP-binding subunit ClpA
VEETVEIPGVAQSREEHHGVRFSDEALCRGRTLPAINHRHLLDKAIDVIDEAGA